MAENLEQFMQRAEAHFAEQGITLSNAERREIAQRFEDAERASISAAPSGPQPNARATFPPPGRVERNIRPALTATGAVLGGVAGGGLSGGPGTIPGSVAGAAGGGILGRGAEEALRARRMGAQPMEQLQQLFSPPPAAPGDESGPLVRTLESAQSYAKTGAGEALFDIAGAGIPAIAPSLARNALWRTAGVSGDDAYRMIRAADEASVPVSIKDVSKHSVVRGYPRILGSFPYINTPMQKAYMDQGLGVAMAHENLIHQIGPSVGMARMGKTMAKSGGRAFKVFKSTANGKYDTALSAAIDANAKVPTKELREVAESILADMLEKQPRKWKWTLNASGNRVRVKVPRQPSSLTAQTRKFARDVIDLTDNMTVEQFRTLSDDLSLSFDFAKKHGLDAKKLMRLKEAMEVDFSHIQAPQEVIALLNQADEFYKAGMDVFQSSTAKKFAQVNRNIFKVGYKDAGPKAIDELKSAVFKEGSPEAIKELRGVILSQGNMGRPVWKATVASHIDEIVQGARKVDEQSGIELLDYAKVRRSLGLDNRKSGEYAALVEMLRGTGVNAGQIERFLGVSEAIFKEGIPNVNQFVRRRAVLGGRKALARSFTGGVTFGAGTKAGESVMKDTLKTATGAAAFIFGTRKLGQIITSPQALRTAMEASKPGLSSVQRTAVLRRLGGLVPGIYAVRNAAGQTVEMTAEQVNEGIEEWTQDFNAAQRKMRVRKAVSNAP